MAELILPSLLSADLCYLHDEVKAVKNAGADMLHFDVMDNHYVPNLTFGPLLCDAIYKHFPDFAIDVHLMVEPVDELILSFAKAHAKRISIHPDATIHLDRSLSLIRDQGCKAGIVLNPATPPDCINWLKHRLDFVLVMTVNPGFGGQRLIPEVFSKIRWIKDNHPDLAIAVDGGVNKDNISELKKAGASEFIAGSAIFASPNYDKAIKELRSALAR